MTAEFAFCLHHKAASHQVAGNVPPEGSVLSHETSPFWLADTTRSLKWAVRAHACAHPHSCTWLHGGCKRALPVHAGDKDSVQANRWNRQPLRSWQDCYTALAAVQAVKKEGVYADGVATLQTLPEALHGPNAAVDVQLRLLLEGERLSEDDVTEHASKECQKVCPQPSMGS